MAYKWLSLGQNHQENQSFALWPKYIKLVLSGDQSSLIEVVPQTEILVLLTGFYKANRAKTRVLHQGHYTLYKLSLKTYHFQMKQFKVVPQFCTAHLLLRITRWPRQNRACEVTLLKRSWLKRNVIGIFLDVVSCRGETQCVGNVHNVSNTRVAEFDFLSENLDSGCLTCAYSLWFSFKRFLYHIVS